MMCLQSEIKYSNFSACSVSYSYPAHACSIPHIIFMHCGQTFATGSHADARFQVPVLFTGLGVVLFLQLSKSLRGSKPRPFSCTARKLSPTVSNANARLPITVLFKHCVLRFFDRSHAHAPFQIPFFFHASAHIF